MVESEAIDLLLRIDRDGQFQQFTLKVSKERSILDLLMEAGQLDRSLLFRHSCHHGSCGTCTCLINGKERLACRTLVEELLEDTGENRKIEGALTVEVAPLKGFPMVKDLVFDPSPMFDRIDTKWPYVHTYQHTDQSETDRKFENCIECGACISACPVTEPFQGPAPLALLHRRLEELDKTASAPAPGSTSRSASEPTLEAASVLSQGLAQAAEGSAPEEKRESLLDQAAKADGATACQRWVECSRVCPQQVAPAKRIQELKNLLSL